ncbi:uncharacterized protein B0T15DRAFT_534446 [Chaetomium strumarium]|uniref:Capsule polysaccharide biosynthesis protein n=1 Tax=Chaetomium strumarium TaxID=1170767 RepID=A0AAJ0GU03_9PEZI|nr:hypothetical protein B0T15DRAFT_534446 [Chaetomium strumarium]
MSWQHDLPEGTRLRPSSAQDPRTDSEIIAALTSPPREVTSQKNIWAFWDKGFSQLHGWQQRNIIGWVRKLGPTGWTVRVLDNVRGSPANVFHYLDYNNDNSTTLPVPEAVVANGSGGSNLGPHSGQHMSDLVRLPLLHRYGGIYLDVGVMLLGDIDKSLWQPIADASTAYRIGGFAHQHRANSWGSMQNFCIAAQAGEELLARWQRIMVAAWSGHSNSNSSSEGLSRHPVFDGVPSAINPRVLMTIQPGSEQRLLDYWVNLLAWEKLKVTIDSTSAFNGPEYVRKHVLLLDPMQEAFAAEVRTRLNTARLFALLTCPRDINKPVDVVGGGVGGGVDPELHAEAKALVEYLLSSSTLLKLYHGHGYMLAPPLATFWEAPGNEDADARPGTFGELLRYGGEVVDQLREVRPIVLPAYDGPVLRGTLP